ncbi:MAG: HDOD domain-containing protein [Deltaproteobacteria bacterium]|nr:HDOD domain-containing protein [Deltaproteobacteria bacterium]
MKKRILFVDDEPNILKGLERMLRSMHQQWDLHFAGGGYAALALMEKERFDVIVSDMRMPKMDGAQLLSEVRKRYPETIRIVLSGHSEKELIMKSVSTAHQYLYKPCPPKRLISVISRSCELNDILSRKNLAQLVSRLDSLPSLPAIYQEIMEALQSDEGSIQKVGEIISRDLGMTTKILQLVNSAFFGLPRHVSTPAQAVALLGMETIKALVLTVSIFSSLDPKKTTHISLDELYQHSIKTATLAKRIASMEDLDPTLVDQAYMAGLLHDIGILVFIDNVPDRFNEVVKLATKKGTHLSQAEMEIMGGTHSQLGAYLLALWGFSVDIIQAVLYHSKPSECVEKAFSPLSAVHVANFLAFQDNDPKSNFKPADLDIPYLQSLGLHDHLPSWEEMARQQPSG